MSSLSTPTLRRSQERGRTQLDWLDSYHTFSFGSYIDRNYHHFGVLRVINEDWIAPDQGFGVHGHQDMEIITVVLEGELQHKDSMGNGSLIVPGQVQRMTAGTGVRHSEFNPNPAQPTHLLQIWIFPQEKGLTPGYEETFFPESHYENRWGAIASPDGREGSVTINQDVILYQSNLTTGNHIDYTIGSKRMVWIQVMQGDVRVDDDTLHIGDGFGLTVAGPINLTANTEAKLLLFDLPYSG